MGARPASGIPYGPSMRQNDSTKHKQIKVRHPAEGIIEVDEGIAPLLVAMWKLGINTEMSCQQSSRDEVWIRFASVIHFGRFIHLVAGKDATEKEIECRVRADRFTWHTRTSVGVWFPCADYPIVLERIERAAASRKKST